MGGSFHIYIILEPFEYFKPIYATRLIMHYLCIETEFVDRDEKVILRPIVPWELYILFQALSVSIASFFEISEEKIDVFHPKAWFKRNSNSVMMKPFM